MSIKFNERFENHMDGIDTGTKGDAKKLDDSENDVYDDGFDEKLSDATSERIGDDLESSVEGDNSPKKEDNDRVLTSRKIDKAGIVDAKGDDDSSSILKKTLSDKPSVDVHEYTMNTPKTIEHMREQMDADELDYFDSQIAAGGGIEGQHAHLRGAGHEYFMTSSSDKKASGNFLTEESPGETPLERKENLQLPPENDATDVDKIVSKRPAVVLTSEVAPQEEWAEKGGYEAKEGMNQVFTPNLNKKGAIEAEIYEIKQPERSEGDNADESNPKKEEM